MLTLYGKQANFCDGVVRRDFLKAGFLGLGGLSLADILRLRANAATTENTAVIFVELAGGPTQFETYDPKPIAPIEYRGPLGVVQTRVAGEVFSELMVEQANVLDKLSIVRSVHHDHNSHDPSSHLSQTGYYKQGPKGGSSTADTMPCFGSIVAKVRGSNERTLPAYVAVPTIMRNGGASYLGKSLNPFETIGDANAADFQVQNLSLSDGLDLNRLDDRRTLLASLDARRRLYDLQGSSEAQDQFAEQAFELVIGSRARIAFDMQRENKRVREAYGRNTTGQSLLLARRLVEMGVTCVTVRVTGWDDHRNLVPGLKQRGPAYDLGIAALVEDLHQRGLSEQVLVVAMGEFGRTPRFNQNAGRDHWGALMSVLLAGGGLKPGIVGASNSKGEVPVAAAYRPENVLAMIYRHLGIDSKLIFDDFAGRPRYILERRELIQELI